MVSRRNYVTAAEIQAMNSGLTGFTENQISEAEELIDAWVGHQDEGMTQRIFGIITAVNAAEYFDTSGNSMLLFRDDYFRWCELEIIGGTGVGQRGIIASSSYDRQSVTMATAFTTPPDNTSEYRIYQLGKFPRRQDVFMNPQGTKYYKSIPENIKRATAAQVEYMITLGSKYFTSDSPDYAAESIGNYSYQKGSRSYTPSTLEKLIAPKARGFLRGFRSRVGRVINSQESNLQ